MKTQHVPAAPVTDDLEVRLARRLGEVLPAVMRLLRQRVSQVGLPDGLTLPQLMVLRALTAGEEIQPGELARHCMMSGASVTGTVDGLVQKGFVDRRHDDRDRRTVRLRLTPAGRAAIERATDLMLPVLHDLIRHLPPDRQERLLLALDDLDSLTHYSREGDHRHGCIAGADARP